MLTVSLFQSTVNTAVFNAWVEQDLLPMLPAKSVVVMDNAAFHKCEQMQQKLREAGHVLDYLPAYSPDLNPIEKKWAQTKAIRCKHQCRVQELFQNHNL